MALWCQRRGLFRSHVEETYSSGIWRASFVPHPLFNTGGRDKYKGASAQVADRCVKLIGAAHVQMCASSPDSGSPGQSGWFMSNPIQLSCRQGSDPGG
jgi:hypothetical protein